MWSTKACNEVIFVLAHHPSEDSYLVREVDLTSEHVNQPSAGQRTEQGNNVKREVDDRKRRHDDERPRDTNKAKRQYEVSNANRQAVWQKSETALKNVTEGDATDAAFGMVRVNGKRMIDIDSLVSPQETKHSGRSRLFIANLAPGVNEADFKTLFERFGNPTEIFVNKEKSFGFVKLVSGYIIFCKDVQGCVKLSLTAKMSIGDAVRN